MFIFLKVVIITIASLGALASLTVIKKLKQPTSFALWGIKVFAGALAPIFIVSGILSSLLALFIGPLWVVLPGGISGLVFIIYLYRVKKAICSTKGWDQSYGPDLQNHINPEQQERFISSPVSWSLPASSSFLLQQDLPFYKIPGTDRELLCDVWRPTENIASSGLAFIYFHGSAWSVLDKDFGTRPFFKHLVAQGHVIMDVAYRLFPETDMAGMIGDVYRAIAWMKKHSPEYNIDPDRIVIGGASAGGHLALMAAYNSSNKTFIPDELQNTDLSVRAVISEYGPTDLLAMYYHTGQHLVSHLPEKTIKPSQNKNQWVQKMMGKNFHRLGMDKDPSSIGVLPVILGCYPDQCPEIYATFSPVKYVNQHCPQTLIIQGEHDLITPVSATRDLYKSLIREGVVASMFVIPQTDHAFDLILPAISPVAHTAFYLIERFLALQAKRG